MKKTICTLIVLAMTLVTVACSTLENQARDTVAALGGLLSTAQTQHMEQCKADATQPVCTTINKGIAAQNALVTAAEAYCGWSAATPPGDTSAKCVPVKTAEAGLQTAVSNANQFITELKGTIH